MNHDHPKLMRKSPSHIAFLALKKVPGGSILLNHSELEYKCPIHHVPLVQYVVRDGSVQLNHPQLMQITPTYLDFFALKRFKKVRGRLLLLNHSEPEYKYPIHLVPFVNMF